VSVFVVFKFIGMGSFAYIMEMSLHIVRVAVPTILGQVFALLVVAANTAFIGHLGNNAMLAGVGLGTLYVNIFCQSIILGLNGALQTLVS
jgi:Na+-driven multidrug efflux pump